jgi:two-component system chemotaxis response regulator CheB
MSEPTRVFALLQDAALRREVQRQWRNKDITLCGVHAEGGEPLVEEVARLRPDVVVVDAEVDGVREVVEGSAKRLRIPVVALVRLRQSPSAVLQPLEWGAVQLVPRDAMTLDQILHDIEQAVAVTRHVQVVEILNGTFPLSGAFPSSEVFDMRRALQIVEPRDKVVVVSAGIGGPLAMRRILQEVGHTPTSPIVFVQRMAPELVDAVAKWLDQHVSLHVERVATGTKLQVGHVYVASSVCESVRIEDNAAPTLRVAPDPVFGEKLVDPLLQSVAQVYGPHTVAVLLSAAGDDGCAGLHAVREAGGFTMVQDRASSMVDEVPCRAREAGCAVECLPINEIADRIHMLMRMDHASSS